MTFDFPVLVIAVVFAAQIWVLSFFAPARIFRAWQSVRDEYPPQEFPRLYPIAPERIARQNRIFRGTHIIVGVASAALLLFCLASGVEALRLARIMVWVYMVQILPALLRLPMQLRLMKAFREMPAPAIRSAELRQLRIVDFISPIEIFLGLAASLLSLVCTVWFFSQNPSVNVALHVFTFSIGSLLLGRMLNVLLRPIALPRPDPYMSADDVHRSRRQRLRVTFRAAILFGLYFTFMQLYAARQIRFDVIYLLAAVSILGQLVYVLATRAALRAFAERDHAAYRASMP